jgi:hypothetical protein
MALQSVGAVAHVKVTVGRVIPQARSERKRVQALGHAVAEAIDWRRFVDPTEGWDTIADGTLGAGSGGIEVLLPRGMVGGRAARSFG